MASQIHELLVEMTQQLEDQKRNITKFNKWVEEQVIILQSRGEEAHDLLTYLWKTYQKAPDAKFVEYIQNLSNDFITGKSNFTAQELMNLADAMYKARVQMNKWALLSTEQEEIVALNAKITQLEQANKPKCKTKEDNMGKVKEKDNKTNDRNWMKEKPTGKEKTENNHPYKTLGRRNIIGVYIITISKDNGCNMNRMNVITNQTRKKIKKRMNRLIWLHLLIQNTVKMKKNDGYARVA